MTALPPATDHPCNDCPWRRRAIRGWLGPFTVDEWLGIVHSDEPIACHQTITVDEEWAPGTRQCRGAAIFRKNVMKLPRDRNVTVGPEDKEKVFGRSDEFREHHDSPLAGWLANQRRRDLVGDDKLSYNEQGGGDP